MRTNFRNKSISASAPAASHTRRVQSKKIAAVLPVLKTAGTTVLTVEDVRYIEDTHVVCTTNLPGCWEFTGKTGDVIGVCGGRSPERGGYDVCEIAGDEERPLSLCPPKPFCFRPLHYLHSFSRGHSAGGAIPRDGFTHCCDDG